MSIEYPNRKMTTTCCVCETVKKQANHWREILVVKAGDSILLVSVTKQEEGLAFLNQEGLFEVHDVCGEGCFHRELSRLLGEQAAEEIQEVPKWGGAR